MNEGFLDLLRAFIAADVRFLVVGAYAVSVHGWPRATGDLDVRIEPTADNASRAYAALRAFGAPREDLTEADLAHAGTVFQMGVVPRRIDVLTAITAVDFAAAWPRRVEGRFAGLSFPVLGRDDLLRNKRAAGRLKDLADVEALEHVPEP